ncbi:MAG: U32 family peptidase [Deltaproteobacteria bacterium]|nr:U32 family peptidase [Deltaproteobacteria bacterium]
MKTPLELLAPAGTAEIGKAAIDHGADAVYIGAPRFSARAQAGNSIDDIAGLVQHAHLFHARVYVALNTILTDPETDQAMDLIRSLYEAGIDGLIIQDVGLLELDLPPIPLIASTQMHNTTPEKVQFLESVGFKRVILARELSLDEIRAIRSKTKVGLEVFVHGALCVSYSGHCYMSQYALGRSGNRGVCAQPCRHQYTLIDGNNKTVIKDKYLLSIKDMNRIGVIGDLVAAGVTSFKIEGRYKEIEYVKNITVLYRQAIDRFIEDNPGYCPASSGTCKFGFKPDPFRTFNRGFTWYFINGEREKMATFDSPKSMGEFTGAVEKTGRDYFRIKGHKLSNGDGLCFINHNHDLTGCRVDKVEENMIFPNAMTDITVGTAIYRNLDLEFTRILKGSVECRTISVAMDFIQDEKGIRLTVKDEDGVTVEIQQELQFEPARNPELARSTIDTQLMRTKDTPYRVKSISISPDQPGFMPLSIINDIRRSALDKLTFTRIDHFCNRGDKIVPNDVPYPERRLDYRTNILNSKALAFYKRHGADILEMALEAGNSISKNDMKGRVVMTTKYCLRHELDACLRSKDNKNNRLKGPLTISDRQHTYRLDFDCVNCRMMIIAECDAPEVSGVNIKR